MVWNVNVWAVLVSAVAYFAVGALWYGALFGKPWMEALGRTREEIAQGGGASISYLWTFLLEVVTCFVLALLVLNSPVTGLLGGAGLGLLVALGIWGTLLAITFLYEGRKTSLYLIDLGYHVVGLVVAGAIVGAWA
jgi:hypothetical protein